MTTKRSDARISPDVIPAMFVSLGIKPIAGNWIGPDNCGCLAIALIGKKQGKEIALDAGRIWNKNGIRFGDAASKLAAAAGFHKDYAIGLIYGWDNRCMYPHPSHTSKYKRLTEAGWQDGRAAALACGLDVPYFDDTPAYKFWFV